MAYRVEYLKSATKQLKRIHKTDVTRIFEAIDDLKEDPYHSGVVQLSAKERLFRIRVGDYRVVYQVNDNILLVLVVKIAHRREVYRGI